MCGISVVCRYQSINEVDIQKLQLMNKEMHYRGPDDQGLWHDEHCGLAQVRLSIIGLEKGKQPLFNEDKSLVLVCNGEIYNYIELKEDLQKKGHIFNSQSDSETILHLYEEYAEECVAYLRGMFTFCIWDTRKKQLFAVRDRIGEKTLYYAEITGGVVFSSELKAILKFYIDKPQINFESLAEPIRYTSPINKKDTFIEQIKRVEPGQYLIVDQYGIRKYQYWRRDWSDRFQLSLEEAKKETFRLMCESVDLCLRSDVPIAVMLSGGVDSSAIAALAKETGREVHTITAGYKGQHDCDERDVARRFAKEMGFMYHEVELDEDDFKDCFDELTQYLDEPITDIAALPQWALYKKVKSLGFKVLLGGIGGDELFYGYNYWNKLADSWKLKNDHNNLLPWKGLEKKIEYLKFVATNLKYIMLSGYPYKIEDKSVGYWTYNNYKLFADSSSFSFDNQVFHFSDVELDFHFKNHHNSSEIEQIYDFLFSKTMTMAYLYLSDRLGMGNSIEIRSPLLDYKLVDFVSKLPQGYKYDSNNPKSLLKDILSKIVPDYILNAQKRGFMPPPSFVNDVAVNYVYKIFNTDFKFYNSALADRILSLHLINNKL